MSKLRWALLRIVADLKVHHSRTLLLAFDDWHEHDGYVTSSQPTTWHALESSLASEAELYASRNEDTYVHRAVYPEDFSFLLRYDLLDRDEDDQYPGIWGTFDVTAPDESLDKLETQVVAVMGQPIIREGSKGYFDSNYAG